MLLIAARSEYIDAHGHGEYNTAHGEYSTAHDEYIAASSLSKALRLKLE